MLVQHKQTLEAEGFALSVSFSAFFLIFPVFGSIMFSENSGKGV